MTIGEIIRKRRKKLGITQMQLGLKCGYEGRSAENTVQHWEHGRQEPSIRVLRRLAAALDVTLEQLIPQDEEGDDLN